jgi:hypothetical protein
MKFTERKVAEYKGWGLLVQESNHGQNHDLFTCYFIFQKNKLH